MCILFSPNMISCNIDLVSRLRTGYMIDTATDYALETSTAQTNLYSVLR